MSRKTVLCLGSCGRKPAHTMRFFSICRQRGLLGGGNRGDSTGTNGDAKCNKRMQAKIRTKVDNLLCSNDLDEFR
jgi:hypothetical protein